MQPQNPNIGMGIPIQNIDINPNQPPMANYNQPAMGNYNQPQMAFAPQNPNHLNSLANFTAQQILNSIDGAWISEKINLTEAMTGCEMRNKFFISEMKHSQKHGVVLFKATEDSTYCCRNCMQGQQREYNINVDNMNTNQRAFVGVRKFQCTCFGRNRPFMEVRYVENGQNLYLGKIVHEFNCCDEIFSFYDEKGMLLYTAHTKTCQKGIVCQCPYDDCQRVEFDLYKGEYGTNKSPILLKKFGKKGCCEKMTDADNYKFVFPRTGNLQTDFRDRALLLLGMIFINYQLFERKGHQN
jgi:hypothetical protein